MPYGYAKNLQEKQPNRKLRLERFDGGGSSVDTKSVKLEILHFKKFNKHFVFDKDEEGYFKKTQKKLHGRKSDSATCMRKHKKYN